MESQTEQCNDFSVFIKKALTICCCGISPLQFWRSAYWNTVVTINLRILALNYVIPNNDTYTNKLNTFH